MNFAYVESIENQSYKFPQLSPSRQKIHRGVAFESREIDTELDPILGKHPDLNYDRQPYMGPSGNVRPDPSDIDIDASANQVKADPDNIDDNINETLGREEKRHYHQPQQLYESDYLTDMSINSNLPSKPRLKDSLNNYVDLSAENAGTFFSQINEFEKRFKRQEQD